MGFINRTQREKALESVVALWNKIKEKIKWKAFFQREKKEERKKRSLVVSPPTFPEIPKPKERPKDRYTVLVLPESGDAKQLALSKSRLKIMIACSGVAIIVLSVLAITMVRYFARQNLATVSSVNPVSQAVVTPRDNIAVSNQVRPSTPAHGDSVDPGSSASVAAQVSKQAVSARSTIEDSTVPVKTGDQKALQEKSKDQPSQAASIDSSSVGSDASSPPGLSATPPTPEPFLINFDAQQVTATMEAPNSGTLSFRLVKDQPDIKFAGYLFVYVEMEDQRGENRIYVYPKQTRLGEGDLPYDFRDGETIAFKFNSRVELPYGDPRPSAALSAVSILLYGENGKIVFQRTFGRQEVAFSTPKANKAEQTKPRGSEKRQAL